MTDNSAEIGTGASRVMFINSRDATQNNSLDYLTTDFTFIPEEAVVVPQHQTILMSLHHTSIPFSFYNFQEGRNCHLDYGLTATGVNSNSTTGTIIIPEANYNAVSLLDKIMELLNAEPNVGQLTIRYNRDTLKYEYNWIPTAAAYGRLTLRIATGTNALTNFRDEIGFNSNKFINGNEGFNVYFDNNLAGGFALDCGYSTDAASTTYYALASGASSAFWTGEGNQGTTKNIFSVVDVSASIRSLYVRSNLTTQSVLDSAVGGGFSSILARIPIDVDSGGVITISPSDGSVHKLYVKVKDITIIGLRLTDQRNRLIDLNGLDWDISLQFDFMEPEEKTIRVDKRTEVEKKKYEKFKEEKEKLKADKKKRKPKSPEKKPMDKI